MEPIKILFRSEIEKGEMRKGLLISLSTYDSGIQAYIIGPDGNGKLYHNPDISIPEFNAENRVKCHSCDTEFDIDSLKIEKFNAENIHDAFNELYPDYIKRLPIDASSTMFRMNLKQALIGKTFFRCPNCGKIEIVDDIVATPLGGRA